MSKKLFKKLLFWNKFSLSEKEKIKSLLGLYTSKIVNPYYRKISDIEVAIFFSDGLDKKYQIEQWLAVFEYLNQTKQILFIVKDRRVLSWLQDDSNFIVVYYQNLESLTDFYTQHNIKTILYVNNGLRNFHSLINAQALHVHINHGESDKPSTISNQAKAYDYSFVVGNAGYDKYKLNLLKKDMNKFIKIGRPQLDFVKKISLSTNTIYSKKVILYAPTWEGNYSSMNFCSLVEYGLSIVSRLLDDDRYYLLYKPHPTTGIRDENIKNINREIIKRVNRNNQGEVILRGDINGIYSSVDLAIFDNSAVAIDYLAIDKPMLMTDMFFNIKDRISNPIIMKSSRLLSKHNMKNFLLLIEEELKEDTLKIERNKIKEYFLGNYDYCKKESSKIFLSKIEEICKERDSLFNCLNQNSKEKKC
jgi:hypothetical protein